MAEFIVCLLLKAKALLQASREVDVEENTERAENVVMCCHQDGGQNQSVLINSFKVWKSSSIWEQQ
jgi:hypothetical protein